LLLGGGNPQGKSLKGGQKVVFSPGKLKNGPIIDLSKTGGRSTNLDPPAGREIGKGYIRKKTQDKKMSCASALAGETKGCWSSQKRRPGAKPPSKKMSASTRDSLLLDGSPPRNERKGLPRKEKGRPRKPVGGEGFGVKR